MSNPITIVLPDWFIEGLNVEPDDTTLLSQDGQELLSQDGTPLEAQNAPE